MSASKDLDLVVHPRTETDENALLMREYEWHQKLETRNFSILQDRMIELQNSAADVLSWAEAHPDTVKRFQRLARETLDKVSSELSALSRSLHPDEQHDPGAIDNC